jgi:hypothetical protein
MIISNNPIRGVRRRDGKRDGRMMRQEMLYAL